MIERRPSPGAPRRDTFRRPVAWAWICAAVAVLVYANALGNGFAYDDVDVILQNDAIHTWRGLVEALGEPYWPGHYGRNVGVWRPVITGLFGVQWMAFDGTPALFHLTGLLLHGAATFVVVLILGSLLPLAAAALGGLVFAVHPVHVEAVSNVVGNAEVLATLLVLLALLVHLRGGERYGWGRTAAVGALFTVGILTKEHAVVLPALIFLVDAARRDPGLGDLPDYVRRRWPTYAVLVALVLGLFAARTAVLGSVAPEQSPSGATLLGEVPRVWTVAGIWPHYVRLLLWPAHLAADYGGIVPVVVRWTPWSVLGVVATLSFLGIGWWGWRTGGPMDGRRLSRRALGFAVVWFGVSILPVSNVVFVSPVLVAERNLYLPSVAAAVGVGYLLAVLLRERRAAGLVVAAVLVLLGSARTWRRTPVWNDTWGAFDALLEDYPEAGRAWFFRGEKLVAQRRFAEARRAYAIALGRMESDYAVASLVASRLMGMGPTHRDAAEFLLLRAWREEPEHYTAPGHLAVLYLNEGRHEEGELFARRAVERAPENADMHRVLAAHLSGLGRHAEAIEERERALALEEEERWTWWVWLARDYAATGDTSRALLSLDSAFARAPEAGPGRGQIDSIRAVWSGGPSSGDGRPPAAGSAGSAPR